MTRANNQIVAAWIEKGDHDLGSAKVIFQYIPEYFRIFTEQQIKTQ